MRKLLRGVLGTALTWAVAWSTLGVGLRVVRVFSSSDALPWPRVVTEQLFPAWQYGFVYGAILGGMFAGLVAVAGRSTRRLNDLSVFRVGAAGAVVAGALHSWVVGGIVMDPYMLASLALGLGSASGTLLMAQRSERLAGSVSGELIGPATRPQLPASS